MNTALATRPSTAPGRTELRVQRRRATPAVTLRAATTADVPSLLALIQAHLAEGRLLPRRQDELTVHAARFVVAESAGELVACAELAPLSGRVAEVRSLVVDRAARGLGIGRELVSDLQRRARSDGYESLCAFTHEPAFFVRLGFSLVPHAWVPEKIALDCVQCPQFRRCGQHAVVLPLTAGGRPASDAFVPLASLRS